MRRILFYSLVFCTAGCGSDSSSPEKAAGISLSISNPASGSSVEKTGESVSGTPSPSERNLESPAVRQLIQKANAAVVAGQHRVAVEAMSQAIGQTPEDANLYRIRADVYVLLQEMANARADYSTALKLSPQNAGLYNVRGYFLMTQGLKDEAIADFDHAIRLDPAFAPAWNNRGLTGIAAQDFAAAITDFSKAIEADRKYADAWNNRGFAKMKLNRSEEALPDIREAIQLKEANPTAWNNLGLAYMQLQQFAEAEKAFSRLIELSPMDARWFNHRRSALLKQEKFAEAQQDARQIEWLNGLNTLTQRAVANAGNPKSWIDRAEHLMAGQQYGAAIQDFTRAIAVNPGNTDALTGRAMAWMQTGDLQKAMQDCDESIVCEASPRSYSLRADLWMMMKNCDQAIEDFEAASRFDEKVAEAYEMRAEKLRDTEPEKAAADLEKAREIRSALAGTNDKTVEAKPVPFPVQDDSAVQN